MIQYDDCQVAAGTCDGDGDITSVIGNGWCWQEYRRGHGCIRSGYRKGEGCERTRSCIIIKNTFNQFGTIVELF